MGVGDVGVFLRCFKQRLVEQYTQDWVAEIETKERYEFYSSFKCIFQSEKYINYQQKKKKKKKFIFGISPNHIHRMRYEEDVVPK